MPRVLRQLTVTTIAVLATASMGLACSTAADRATPRRSSPSTTARPRLVLASALVGEQNCDDLLAWIRSQARTRVGPYGLEGGTVMATSGVEDMAVAGNTARANREAAPTAAGAEPPAAASADESTTQSTSGADETVGTNNQEAGVDEIDRFKTDGRRVVMTDGQRLMAIDITTDTPRRMGVVDLPMSGARLFLAGDRVLAVGDAPGAPSGRGGGGIYVPRTSIAIVSLASGAPVVGQTTTVDGRLVDSRSAKGQARLVVSSPIGADLAFTPPAGYTPEATKAAIDTNRAVVDQAPIEAWLPRWTPAGGSQQPLIDCPNVYHPKEWSGAAMLSVLTVGDELTNLQPTGVISDGQTVYASSTGLYVATQKYGSVVYDDNGVPTWPESNPSTETTALHRFDISTSGAAIYQGSGEVPGHLINQFAMSEADGDLRVATTVSSGGGLVEPMPMPADCATCATAAPGAPTATASESATPESATAESAIAESPTPDSSTTTVAATPTGPRSMLTVLRLDGGELRQIGRLDGLGPNEQIQSVRFVGNRAYVVTFRQMDPLFVIDVSDPTAPKLLGELKEPGFSSYLHPVGPDRMLGVGTAATDRGMTTGAKVTLYDTSDPTHPRAVTTVPVAGGFTSAGGDSHAFNWDPERHLAFVPLTLQSSEAFVSGIAVYKVEGDTVDWLGFLQHRDHAGAPVTGDCGGPAIRCMPMPYEGGATVDRVVIVGDSIYAASTAGVSRHAIDTLAENAWVGWN